MKKYPPDASSGMALQQWMCGVHNEVNESLGKPRFDCSGVDARWGGVEGCGDEDGAGCSLEGRRKKAGAGGSGQGGGAGGSGQSGGAGGGGRKGRLGTF